jgi:hypothetical protein
MDVHHDTSFKSILKYDSISFAFRIHICSCSNKRAGLWLVAKLFIHSFHIAHFTFTSKLHFCLNLIQPSTSSIFTCECGHGLDAFNTHLVRCLFGGQWIATHDAIWNVMYAFVRKKWACCMESGGTPLLQKFHYELIFTWLKKTRFSLPMWWLLTWCGKQWLQMSLVDQ